MSSSAVLTNPSVERVRAALERAGMPTEIVELPGAARTAKAAADFLGCGVAQIANSLVFRAEASDTAVLVNRGWVYAADGATIDEERFRERDSVFVGYAEVYPSPTGTTYAGKPKILARLGADAAARAIPYPIALFYVVELGDSTGAADRAARLTVPPLDEGPHASYAVQWFAFAAIALAGAAFVVKQSRDGGGKRAPSRVRDASAESDASG